MNLVKNLEREVEAPKETISPEIGEIIVEKVAEEFGEKITHIPEGKGQIDQKEFSTVGELVQVLKELPDPIIQDLLNIKQRIRNALDFLGIPPDAIEELKENRTNEMDTIISQIKSSIPNLNVQYPLPEKEKKLTITSHLDSALKKESISTAEYEKILTRIRQNPDLSTEHLEVILSLFEKTSHSKTKLKRVGELFKLIKHIEIEALGKQQQKILSFFTKKNQIMLKKIFESGLTEKFCFIVEKGLGDKLFKDPIAFSLQYSDRKLEKFMNRILARD